MKDIPKQLKPYFRKVIAHPEEAVVHEEIIKHEARIKT